MGSFYTNITLKDVTQEQVVKFLQDLDRSAFVSPTAEGITVVFDAECESQDHEVLRSLAEQLSRNFGKTAFAVLNHDDDALLYWLYSKGRLLDSYDSMSLFYDGEEEPGSVKASARKLAAAFAAEQGVEKVKEVLQKPGGGEGYVFASDRHRDLLKSLQIPTFAAGCGFNYIDRGMIPEGIDVTKLKGIARKGKVKKSTVKKERRPEDVALMEAVRQGDVTTVKSLLQAGADANVRDMGEPAIIEALMCREPGKDEEAAAIVRLLIDAGADVNVRGFDGIRALHEAVRAGMTGTVKALLAAGAKVSHRDSMGETALDVAEEEENEEIMRMLEEALPKGKKLKKGADMMMDAILKGQRSAMKLSQQFQDETKSPEPKKGAWREEAGIVTLIAAARRNSLKALQHMINEGVDVNARDMATGQTALMLAAQEGHREIVEALLKAGADKDLKTGDGKTALDLAEEKVQQAIVDLLSGKATGGGTL